MVDLETMPALSDTARYTLYAYDKDADMYVNFGYRKDKSKAMSYAETVNADHQKSPFVNRHTNETFDWFILVGHKGDPIYMVYSACDTRGRLLTNNE